MSIVRGARPGPTATRRHPPDSAYQLSHTISRPDPSRIHDVATHVREPDKFAELASIDPASPPEDLFPATAALLERFV